ncbi:lysoplasmalogenase [Ferruginibacter sp. HRS2-29]|uniref:lysoplasmalogenase n=1 Tax=Ferruginibacter sp. HRS2-29 TaxID=2487334 RepID=UPI0020CC0768|nr:lysoplasmalogenase [Ferruginibacter sp. HRS2-29]MCP9753098.1 lysoplasmalogenase [Ferruginibacter sp. HRS2-29]
MRSSVRIIGFIIFGLLVVADLSGILLQYEPLHRYAKPLLMPVLFFTALFSTGPGKGKWLILTGLLFSFAGDVFLMYDQEYPIFFILGLLSFLITHVLYIIYFLRIPSAGKPSLLKKYPGLFLLILIYVGSLLTLLFPFLEALKIPVLVYALILGSMLLAALHAFSRLERKTALFFAIGATFFVLSDSLLAIDKFYASFAQAGFLIMLTYCVAQFFIVKGFLKKL